MMHKACVMPQQMASASAETGRSISVPGEQDGATPGGRSNVHKGAVAL